jgi:cleavage and polyadenylation specificity factor subunit 3
VFDTVDVKEYNANHVVLEWTGNSVNDMVADSVLAVILNIESSPASVKLTKSDHTHSHTHGQPHKHGGDDDLKDEKKEGDSDSILPLSSLPSTSTSNSFPTLVERSPEDEFQDLVMFFASQFGTENVEQDEPTQSIKITMDGVQAMIDCTQLTVRCDADALRHRAQNVLERAVRTCM